LNTVSIVVILAVLMVAGGALLFTKRAAAKVLGVAILLFGAYCIFAYAV
jgi:uncharacterized Tic20 family protein